MGFVQALASEIVELEEALEADPRFMKLRELRRIKKLYDGDASPRDTDSANALASPDFGESKPRRKGRRGDPRRAAALDAARDFMRDKTSPVKTSDIWEALEAQGVKLGGLDPQNNLSALIYRSNEYESFGRSGWLLKDREPHTTDDSRQDSFNEQDEGVSTPTIESSLETEGRQPLDAD